MTDLLSALLLALQIGGLANSIQDSMPLLPEGRFEGRVANVGLTLDLHCDGTGNCTMLLNDLPSEYENVHVVSAEVMAYVNKTAAIAAAWRPDLPTTEFSTCYDLGNPLEGRPSPLHSLLCTQNGKQWAAFISSSKGEYTIIPLSTPTAR